MIFGFLLNTSKYGDIKVSSLLKDNTFWLSQGDIAKLFGKGKIFYNLDMIISISYRVNSKEATQFRIWATSVLKNHITEGFTINPQRLKNNYMSFLKAVEDVKKLLKVIPRIKTE